MIVISPVAIASSFNYYFQLPNPQSNYPHEERRGAIDYVDLRKRLLDPASIAKTRSRIVQAHREGRRIWFITLPQILSTGVPKGDRLIDSEKLTTFTDVGGVRANQIHSQIEELYGLPSCIVVSGELREASESLHAELYDEIPTLPGTVLVPHVQRPAEARAE